MKTIKFLICAILKEKHRSNKKSMDAYIMKTTLLIDFIETAIAHNKKHFFFDVIVPNFDRLVFRDMNIKDM